MRILTHVFHSRENHQDNFFIRNWSRKRKKTLSYRLLLVGAWPCKGRRSTRLRRRTTAYRLVLILSWISLFEETRNEDDRNQIVRSSRFLRSLSLSCALPSRFVPLVSFRLLITLIFLRNTYGNDFLVFCFSSLSVMRVRHSQCSFARHRATIN